jgi:hypothetical protein
MAAGNLRAPLQQDSQTTFNFLHCVRPRDDDYDPDALDERSMPFSSYYVSIEGNCLMAPERGYRDFPYAVSRYDQTPGEVYGRGPAMLVLPSLKTLNAQKIVFLKQGHRAADPVLLIADDGIVGMDMRPGAQNKGGVNSRRQVAGAHAADRRHPDHRDDAGGARSSTTCSSCRCSRC